MTSIILRSLAPAKEDRWQDPADMGQALAAYLQSAAPAEEPIAPLAPEPQSAPQAAPEQPQPGADQVPEVTEGPPAEAFPAETVPETAPEAEITPAEEIPVTDGQMPLSDATIRMDLPESSSHTPDSSVLDQGTVRFSPAGVAVKSSCAGAAKEEDDVVFPVIAPQMPGRFRSGQ